MSLKMPATNPFPTLAGSRLLFKLLGLTLLVAGALLFGREFAHHIPSPEEWITAHGWLGPMVFVGGTIVLTSMFVPDTMFAVIAGALFGVLGGTLAMIAASLCTAGVNFALSRLFLHDVVCRALARHPRLAAIHRAVGAEGFRFQFLLRLTPLNPVALNYVLGASGTHFPTYLAACAGMIPLLAVEVYFGHVAKHLAAVAGGVAEPSKAHTILTLVGLAVCVAVMVYILRIARTALAAYESRPTALPAASAQQCR